LKAKGLTDEQAKVITRSAEKEAATKKSSIGLTLADPDTPAELELFGFTLGAVAALDEASVTDKTMALAVLNSIIEVVQKSLANRTAEFGTSLKDMPASIMQASMLGLKNSGVQSSDFDEALKEISKEIMDNLDDAGIASDVRDDAAGEMVKIALGGLDELGIPKEEMDELSAAMMSGAIDGVPSELGLDEIKAILEIMNASVADGFKDAGLTDSEMAEQMKAVAEANSKSIDDIGLDISVWDDIAAVMNKGLIAGLDEAEVEKSFFDDVIASVSEGSVNGSEALNAELTDEQMKEMIASFSRGSTEGITQIGLSKDELSDYADDVAKGAGAGLASVDVPQNIKDQMEEAIGKSTMDGLVESGLTQEELEAIAAAAKADAEAASIESESSSNTEGGTITGTSSESMPSS
jgi:hypothetical protein